MDRHPAGAVTAGLFTLVFMGMMLSVHPVAALALIAVAGAMWALRAVGRERERRAALAARADYDYRALLAAPLPAVRPLPQRATPSLPWRAVRLLRTEPMRAASKP